MSPAKRPGRSATPAPRSTAWIVGRVLLGVIGLGALAFAVQGGEYGTSDLLSLRTQLARERAAVDSLTARVAELEAYRKRIETDPVTQERIAREEFGMVREGEALYRFAEPR